VLLVKRWLGESVLWTKGLAGLCTMGLGSLCSMGPFGLGGLCGIGSCPTNQRCNAFAAEAAAAADAAAAAMDARKGLALRDEPDLPKSEAAALAAMLAAATAAAVAAPLGLHSAVPKHPSGS